MDKNDVFLLRASSQDLVYKIQGPLGYGQKIKGIYEE